MSSSIDHLYPDIVERAIQQAIDAMFPYGEGNIGRQRVEHHLNQVAQQAFNQGKAYALMGLMTVSDVAAHFNISERRARALIKNRHERLGTGMQVGNTNVWLVHRDELDSLAPDDRYRTG